MVTKKLNISAGSIPQINRPLTFRRTRSTTGSLPEGSANAKTATKKSTEKSAEKAQDQPSTVVEETKEQDERETAQKAHGKQVVTEGTQVQHAQVELELGSCSCKNASQHPLVGPSSLVVDATPPDVQSTVKQICANEASPLISRIDELVSTFTNSLADQAAQQQYLATAIATIKEKVEHSTNRESEPPHEMDEVMRTLRTDVNTLLESARLHADHTPKSEEERKDDHENMQDLPERKQETPLWREILDNEDPNG